MVEGKCVICEREFKYFPSQRRICCSTSCAARYRNQRLQSEGRLYVPSKPRRGETTPCGNPACSNSVYHNESQTAKGQGKYCSRACLGIMQTKPSVVKVCALVGCDKELVLKPSQVARQYCSKAHEALGKTKRPGERLHNGRPVRYDNQGYVMVWEPGHPNKAFKGWQYEHRLVAEKRLGRYLLSSEHVHHINHVRDDNRDENLEVMDGNDHARLSGQDFRDEVQAMRAKVAEYERRFGPLE